MAEYFTETSIPQLEMIKHVLTRLEGDGVRDLPTARQRVEEALRQGHRRRQRLAMAGVRTPKVKHVSCPKCGEVMTEYARDNAGAIVTVWQCDGGGTKRNGGCRFSFIDEGV